MSGVADALAGLAAAIEGFAEFGQLIDAPPVEPPVLVPLVVAQHRPQALLKGRAEFGHAAVVGLGRLGPLGVGVRVGAGEHETVFGREIGKRKIVFGHGFGRR